MHESFFMALRAIWSTKTSLLIFQSNQDDTRVLVLFKGCNLITMTTVRGGASRKCQADQNPARMALQGACATTCRMHVSVCKIYVRTACFSHAWHGIEAMTGWHIPSAGDMQIALDDNYLTSDQLNVIYSRRAGRYIRRSFLVTPVIRQIKYWTLLLTIKPAFLAAPVYQFRETHKWLRTAANRKRSSL